MNQSKSAEQKEPGDGALITSIPNISLYMDSYQQQQQQRKQRIQLLFQENFRVSTDVALAFAQDMVEVVIPEGRDENAHLFQMATERGIHGKQIPSGFVPVAVSSQLKAFKLGELFVGARGDRAETTIHAIRCPQDLKQISAVTQQLRDELDSSKLLYHGVVNSALVIKQVGYGFQYLSSQYENPNELWDGIYCSYSLEHVFKHISKYKSGGQAILVFDWSQVDDLENYHVYGDSWKILVKQHICIFNDQKRAEIGYPPFCPKIMMQLKDPQQEIIKLFNRVPSHLAALRLKSWCCGDMIRSYFRGFQVWFI
ncbi:hypothetical protein MIR68_011532 [Amoeboaphelidium protococcarum]|nr:hypothetical protein MIR68_011532 [Amoeboaphelidium protococcarum]